MRLTLLGLCFLAAPILAEPSQSDRYKIAPLVATAKLWNLIRYLHPRVTGDSTAWDTALIAALPKIEAAHSDDDLAVALDDMLKTLHDPCTRIAFGLPGAGVTVQSFDSDTMVIHAGNGDLSGSLGAGLMLKMGIPQTNNLVWDVRSSRMPFSLVNRPDLLQLTLDGIGYAFRQHSGYPPQEGSGLAYYSSSLQVVEPKPAVATKSSPKRRQVYLIDKDSAVPVQAVMDQVNGRAAIFSEDAPQSSQAGYTELVNVLGKVVAEVRVAELYYADGTTEFAPTRVVLNRGQAAVKAAAEALQSGGWGMPGERPDFGLMPSAFRDVPYAEPSYPNREMRILCAFRIWGIMHYFNPVVAPIGKKWDDALVEYLPKFSEAKDAREYQLTIAEMVARTGDMSSRAKSTVLDTVFGVASPPYEVRMIENQPVITSVFKSGAAQPGDVILKVGGEPVQKRIDEVSRYFAGPPMVTLGSQLGRFVLTVRRKDNTEHDIPATGDLADKKYLAAHRTGDAVRIINEKIGYADLERVESAELDAMFEKFRQTSAIVFDLRGYPRDTVLAIAARLGSLNQAVAAGLQRNVVGIGANETHINFLQTEFRLPPTTKPRYAGKTVALIDDASRSITAEGAMCFKAANGTVLIGSTALPIFSGHSTVFDVPGGAKVYFAGQSTRWPDGSPLQQGSVHPDVEVLPTIAGIREGRDEVLDKAIAYLAK
jgi:C-terminal processing protease CtpA/Prc